MILNQTFIQKTIQDICSIEKITYLKLLFI